MGLEAHILWPCEIVLLSRHVRTSWGSEGLPLWRAVLTSFLCAPSTETASSSGDLFFVHYGFIYDMHLPAFSSLHSILRRKKKGKKKRKKERNSWCFYKTISPNLYSGIDWHIKAQFHSKLNCRVQCQQVYLNIGRENILPTTILLDFEGALLLLWGFFLRL